MLTTWNRCGLLLLLAGVACFRTWSDLWRLWETKGTSYSHGVLIAGIFVWLFWRARTDLNRIPVTANVRVAPLVLLLSVGWVLAASANLFVAHSVLWPLLAFALIWAGAGWAAARRLSFALAFLYFAMPLWDYLEPSLHFVASRTVGFLISVTGTRATVDGSYILLPQATILIALACSGAHFLAISLAMGALAGEVRGDTWRMRVLIMGVAALFGIASNAVRILLIVLAYLNPKLQAGFETIGHITFGWWVFAFDIALFFLTLRLFPMSSQSKVAGIPAGTVVGEKYRRAAFPMAICAGVLPPLLTLAASRIGHYTQPTPQSVPVAGSGGPLSPDQRWEPAFEGPSWFQRAAYLLPNGRVMELYVNEYHQQSEGKELFSSHSRLFRPDAFSEQNSEAVQLLLPGSGSIEAWQARVRDKSGRDWLAIHTYVIDGEAERDSRRTRILLALRSIYARPTAGIFAVATPCIPDCGAVQPDLERFAAQAYSTYETRRNSQ